MVRVVMMWRILGCLAVLVPHLAHADECANLQARKARIERQIARLCSPTPAPKPTPQAAIDCSDGPFGKTTSGFSMSSVTLEVGRRYHFCVDLPPSDVSNVEIYTINKANTSCSDLGLTLVSPSGKRVEDFGPAPVVRARHETGRWGVEAYLYQGCNKYEFQIPFKH